MTLEILNYLIEIAALNSAQTKEDHKTAPPQKQVADELSAWVTTLAAEKESGDILSKIKYRLALLALAKKDPSQAEELLSANVSPDKEAFPLIDFTEWPTVRYAVSGELQTADSEAYFARVSAAAFTIREAIVSAERAKGTPAFSILEKVLALNSALPERYKAMANIQY
ncbi:hypothetical protein ACUY4R_002259 [Kosakonia sp. BK9b]|uniref:hypothetical protein n=1 Tax=Kosakonia sp. TaxID=1916651 RepID=UPI00289F97C1|nr:hypothetical protein [Kosakonia sp.]